eukprot:CAMPEP_0115475716 /NCGR_PEP_ID=MMETSP0271-20121206/54760_1 /TAXON_ID=71861 /ORGANISM="Scrippsiella trochoidea, Strain CCMP3099" /LENGTH=79 /DNA_ID=CAMNT_0002903097 /DNA_START=573 /DNA_END=812 /DNA_ORIENTATION=-
MKALLPSGSNNSDEPSLSDVNDKGLQLARIHEVAAPWASGRVGVGGVCVLAVVATTFPGHVTFDEIHQNLIVRGSPVSD